MVRPLGDLGNQPQSVERLFAQRDALLTRDVM